MKKHTPDELKANAARIMKAHKVDHVYCTEDGEIFLPNDKSLAYDHNAKNVKGEVIKITSGEEATQSKKEAASGAQEEAIEKARGMVTDLMHADPKIKVGELRKQLSKAGFEADVVALVTTKEELHKES